MGVFATIGVTAGAHRLWSHKAYKATWQLRVILMILNSMSFQNSIYEWVRDHRWVNNIQIEKLTGKWYFFCSGCIISTQRRMPIHILSPGNANFLFTSVAESWSFSFLQGLFLRSHGLADGQEASGCESQRQGYRYERSGEGRSCNVPKTVRTHLHKPFTFELEYSKFRFFN